MIGFRIDGEELDLNASTSVQVEYYSGLFEIERIPGMLTFPVTLPWSKKNKRLLGFPGNLSVRRYRREPFDCQMYLGNLWRIGKLYILGTSDKGISVNFQSDIGDLGDGFKNDSLHDLDLGSVPLSMAVQAVYPESTYALFPVYNPVFYDNDEAFATYAGYLNYYDTSFKTLSTQHPCTPFPYLVHIMRQVMAHYGYRITGQWLEEEETRRLVIYNTYALDAPEQATVEHRLHVPDIKVNEFMKAIRAAFGLGYLFNTATKTMEVVRLNDVVQITGYVDWQARALQVKGWKPNDTDGFRLELTPDSSDELNKVTPPAAVLQLGKGKDLISAKLGTLHMRQEGSRLLPQARQEGSSGRYAGSDGFSLSLLSYRGLEGGYPLGSSQQLAWTGAEGLYEQCHRHWLDFLGETESIETEINLNITDLRTLRPERKVLVRDGHTPLKAFWTKISVTISLQDGIKTAKAPLLKVGF
jgi:hypothetical protein